MHTSPGRFARFASLAALIAGLILAPSALASQTLGSRTLREGMRGGDVASLQHLLTRLGYPVRASGVFGGVTRTRVIQFERQDGLQATGTVTPADVNAMRRALTITASANAPTGGVSPASAAAASSPTLRVGSKGRWVTVLQQDLTFAGYATSIDGVFGQATLQAANDFKQAHGLAINGYWGGEAWSVLRSTVQSIETTFPTRKARLNPDGLVTAPANAPTVVKEVIAAANQIAKTPYCYAGGHGAWKDSCYDCSGSVGYALHGGGLLSVTEDSGEMESYGSPGYGHWITLFANAGHVYMQVAGLWFDTAAQSSQNGDDRWSTTRISPASGFVIRHPMGL